MRDLSFDRRDSAPYMPRCKVIDTAFTWGDDRRARACRGSDTVIYEMHVRGFTMRHPDVPPSRCAAPTPGSRLRAGDRAPEAPRRHHRRADAGARLRRRPPARSTRGLRNYWGYNTIGFFAPEPRYCASGKVGEFKTMVEALHSAGIEVILDVVYNHTARRQRARARRCRSAASTTPPTTGWRRATPRYYQDFTGCGNTLNMRAPARAAAGDGFAALLGHRDARRRLPLRPRLRAGARAARRSTASARSSTCCARIRCCRDVKLIAEPWDLGDGGYQVGNFPVGWAEWNDQYRDTMRAYWKGDGGLIGEFAQRLTGSSDLYNRERPRPVRQHQLRHRARRLHAARPRHLQREAQRGQRRGQPRRPRPQPVVELRRRRPDRRRRRSARCASASKRNFLATLLLSQGVPMLLAGDEIGRTQQGNNNAYCQDNEIGWLDWALDDDAARAARVHAAPDRAARRASGVPAARLLPGPAAARRPRRRTSSGCSPTAAR